ncbi:cytochrome c maturation protein CcmE [Candidatus Methylomirabilis sp.]|uniref:cytochrome c maturation protein CcmE n=1 Tax=Candidatus Methylomirabilis sp. TaxID=2032687 RepID=UPI002A5DA33A|nr:cytochrome c maturation protein CcmE [Candidatus Methylomirabilis sp.]
MTKKTKLLLGGGIVVAALAYLINSGIQEATVYYITPSELKAKGGAVSDRSFRLGGMVVPGSLHWEPQTLKLTFRLTDGKEEVPVEHTGSPPDLFKEGAGAVVEGKCVKGGPFQSSMIMAKHSEEYKPPEKGQTPTEHIHRTLVQPQGTQP